MRRVCLEVKVSDVGIALDIYHVTVLLVGVPWLMAASRGLRSKLSDEYLLVACGPILAVHILVIPTHFGAGPWPWALIAAHTSVAAPMGVALLLVLQQALSEVKSGPVTRILLACGGCLVAVSSGIWYPGAESVVVILSLTAISVAGAAAGHVEMG